MKKRSLFAGGALALALTLSACGGGGGEADAELADAPTALGGEEAAAQFDELYNAAVDAGESELVIYTPLTSQYTGVFETFSERFPEIRVSPLQIVGAEMDTRIKQEQSSGQHRVDMVLTGDTGAVKLSNDGNLVPYEAFNAEEAYADPGLSLEDGTLLAATASQRGIVVDTRQDLGIEITKWADVADPALKGKIAMTDPTTIGGGMQWADTMLHAEGLGRPFLEDLAANDPELVATTAECHNAVTQGRVAACLSGDLGTYQTLKERNAPLDYIYPLEDGNVSTFFYAGIVENAPHENAAKLFINWMSTPEANDAAAEVGQAPVAGETSVESLVPPMDEVPQIPRPPLDEVNERQTESLDVIREIFG